jgi:hypothetical protein
MKSINLNRLDKSLPANMKSFEVEYEKFDYFFKKDIVHGFDYIVAFDEEDAKSREEFLTKIKELSISLIQDETKRLTEERKLQFKKEKEELINSDGFKKAQKAEQNEALSNLDRKLQDDLTKIFQDGEQKRLDSSAQTAQLLLSNLNNIDQIFTTQVTARQSEILNLTDTIGAYFGEAGIELEDYVKNIGDAITREQFNIKSISDLIEVIFQSNLKQINQNEEELIKSYKNVGIELKAQQDQEILNLKNQLSTKEINLEQYKKRETEINDFYNKKRKFNRTIFFKKYN